MVIVTPAILRSTFIFIVRRFTWLYILGDQQHLYFYTLSIDCFLTGGLGLAQIHTGNSLNQIHVFYPLDFVMCNKTDLVWIWIITPLLTSWVTLSKFLNLPESSLLICQMRTDHFLQSDRGFIEMIYVKWHNSRLGM